MTGTDRADGLCIWLTGAAGAGKSTIARAVIAELERAGKRVALLDDDERRHLDDDVAALAWFVSTLTDRGVTVVVAADAPRRDDREHVREHVARFAELFVDGGAGTGTDAYEEPFAPELRVPTHDRDPAASIALVVSWLEHVGAL